MSTTTQSSTIKARLNADGLRHLLAVAFFLMAEAVALFVTAGTWRWPAAWAYLGVYLACYAAGLTWVASVNPAVLNERGRKPDNTEAFDRRFHRLMPLILFSALVVGGLDHRFNWSDMPGQLQLVGLLLLVPAQLTSVWVLATNAYAARVVRLQDGHQVVTTGPYRYVRHPMYTGTLLSWVAAALALGSWWMFIPAAAGIILFIWRTAREDATLQEKLPGYRDYTGQTRYRLVPWVW